MILSRRGIARATIAILIVVIVIVAGVAYYFLTLPPPGPEKIKIGLALPMTGAAAFIGETAHEASVMAAEKINDAGGILGKPVELVLRDTAAEVEKGVTAAERLVTEDKVVAIVGYFRSGVALAVLETIAKLKVPTLITGAASPKIIQPVTEDYNKYKYLFRPVHINSAAQPIVIIDFIANYLKPTYGIDKVAIIAENAEWTIDYAGTLKEELPKYGVEIVYETRPPLDATEFTTELTLAREEGAQVIIPIISTSSGIPFTKQWAELKIPALLIGTNNPAVRLEFWEETEGKTNYQTITQWGGPVPITDKTIPFYNEYRSRWGRDPAYMAWNQYDALFILADSINRAGSTDADAIIRELEKTDYIGVCGRIQILKSHETRIEVGYRTLLLTQWQDGELPFVWPESVKQKDFIVPDWMIKEWTS